MQDRVQLLDEAAITNGLETLPGWERRGTQGAAIGRTFRCRDFVEAVAFVNRVADAAEAANHHPDIDIRYNRISLVLTTHSAGGLTEKDFTLAHEIEGLAPE